MTGELRERYTRWRTYSRLRGALIGPAILVSAFIAVTVWGYWENSRTADPALSTFWRKLYATLDLYTGTYVPLSPDQTPNERLAAVSTAALALTLITAGSLLLLSRRVYDFFRIGLMRSGTGLLIIGGGATASALVKSSIERQIPAILLTDNRVSAAARATDPSIPIIAVGQLKSALSTPSGLRVIQRTRHVVVATDSDSLNMELTTAIREIRDRAPRISLTAGTRKAPTDLVAINDPLYAELLYPAVIRDVLPGNEVTCPAENVAEHICHLLVAAATGSDAGQGVVVDVIDVVSGGYREERDLELGLAGAIRRAVERLGWSLSFVRGAEGLDEAGPRAVPTVRLGSATSLGPDDLLVQIFTGASSSAIAAAVMWNAEPAAIQIAVADFHVIAGAGYFQQNSVNRVALWTGRDWLGANAPLGETAAKFSPPLLVIDPADVGLDAALVTDDFSTQWARTFDVTYGLMFSDGTYAVTGWQPGAPMGESTRQVERQKVAEVRRLRNNNGDRRTQKQQEERAKFKARKEIGNRYSSKRAVEMMLELLDDRGYELRRWAGEERPPAPSLSDQDVAYIAAAEHADWRVRTWPDSSRVWRRRRREKVSDYSLSGANKYTYDELVGFERDSDAPRGLRYAASYNRRIATEAYPAIAASFGYAIVARAEGNVIDDPDA